MYDHNCTLCPLHESAGSVCLAARGARSNVDVLFVGESPTIPADAKGRAFADYEGQVLSDCIKQMGIENYALTYAVKCVPEGDRGPKVASLNKCLPYLAAEIEAMQPEWVVPMGNAALRAITTLYPTARKEPTAKQEREGLPGNPIPLTGITKWSGRELDLPGDAPRCFPLISARSIGKSADNRARFESDVNRLAQTLAGEDVTPRYPMLERDEADRWLRDVAACEEVHYYSIDLETTAKNPRFGEIQTVALRAHDQTVWFRWTPRLRDALYTLLRSGKTMVAHSASFELKWLLHHVVLHYESPQEATLGEWQVGDSLLMHHLLDENAKHALSLLAKRLTDIGGYDDEMESAKAKQGEGAFTTVPVEVLGNYNAGDADVCYRLYEQFYDRLVEDERLFRFYWKYLVTAIWTVAWAEYNGRRIDPSAVQEVRRGLEVEVRNAFAEINAHPGVSLWIDANDGKQINFNSAQQLADLLVNYLHVPITARTEGGAVSVSETTLLHHAPQYKFIRDYLRWKKALTLLNNYLGSYPTQDEKGKGILGFTAPDGFLYGQYLLHGTVTGRLSSRQPNLQNFHKSLRRIVRSRFPGGSIMEADYSQLELRLIAWQSGCEFFLRAFREGLDPHGMMAADILSKDEDSLEGDERKDYGKTPNFGLTYGMRPRRFGVQFQKTPREAKFIHQSWHARVPEIGEFIERQHRKARVRGVLRSRLGRVRRIPEARIDTRGLDWEDPRKKRQMHALLSASNFETQSLASDFNTIAVGWVRHEIARRGLNTLLIGMTHDSGNYDVPPGEGDAMREILPDCMVRRLHETFPWIGVPLEIDVSAGDSWGDLA